MKKGNLSLAFALFSFLALSCQSTPATADGATDGVSPQVAGESVAPDAVALEGTAGPAENAVSDPSVVTGDSGGLPAPDGTDAANGTVMNVETYGEIPKVAEAPETEAPAPMPPPGERIISFYPEPDLFMPEFSVPEPKPTDPPVPVKEASVPATVSASASSPRPVPADAAAALPAESATSAVEAPGVAGTSPENEAAVRPEAGIWTTEPTAPAVMTVTTPEKKAPSRSVTLEVGQSLQVWYPGSGWVYLGDASTLNGLAYDSRKLDKSDTLFAFKALQEGHFILDFSRYDVLGDAFSEDSLAVTVQASAKSRGGTVRAPDYRGGVNATASTGETGGKTVSTADNVSSAASGNTGTSGVAGTGGISASKVASSSSGSVTDEPSLVATGTPSSAFTASASVSGDAQPLLDAARGFIDSGDPASALKSLDGFFSRAVTNLDEGWFLRGQAYEANGDSRNVKKALDAYQTLVDAFPESPQWKAADARIRYIKRFYLNIR